MDIPVWLLAGQMAPRGRTLHTLYLAKYLSEFGFDPTIVCENASALPLRLTPATPPIEGKGMRQPLLGWWHLRRLVHQCKRPPALIHAQEPDLDLVAVDLAERFKCPYLLTVHEKLPNDETLRVLPDRLGGLIAVSPCVHRDLLMRSPVPDSLIEMIPSGVDPAPTLPAPRSSDEIPVVGCAGALEVERGITYFLMAAEVILSSGHDVEFLIAGSGAEEELLRRAAQHLDIANRVTFASQARDFRPMIEACDVFVMPSLEQGQATILLEAMALGKPIVLSRVGAAAEFLADGEHALFVPPANHVLLAEKIQFLVDNPERARRLGIAAQALMVQRFTAREMTQRTAALYRKILSERASPPAIGHATAPSPAQPASAANIR